MGREHWCVRASQCSLLRHSSLTDSSQDTTPTLPSTTLQTQSRIPTGRKRISSWISEATQRPIAQVSGF
jgi:hypothetical protein